MEPFEHFDDKPFNKAHLAISEIDKVHYSALTELERAVIRHCQAMLSNVYSVAKRRHYAEQDAARLAHETAEAL